MVRKTVLRVLGEMLAKKDPTTQLHVMRTQVYAVGIARNMNCSRSTILNIDMAALLHDLGKVFVDDQILNKPEALTEDEKSKMRQHPVTGADIVSNLKLNPLVIEGIRHHHERWDGTGYPDGIRAEAIPFIARVVAVADCYDALVSDRCYRQAMPRLQALKIMREEEGQHFDPAILRIFLRYLPALEEEVADFVPPSPIIFADQLEAAALRSVSP